MFGDRIYTINESISSEEDYLKQDKEALILLKNFVDNAKKAIKNNNGIRVVFNSYTVVFNNYSHHHNQFAIYSGDSDKYGILENAKEGVVLLEAAIEEREGLISSKKTELNEVIEIEKTHDESKNKNEIKKIRAKEEGKNQAKIEMAKIEANERQQQRDFELRKLELELQLKETQLLREREERETNRANINSLRDTLKDS